MSRLFSSRKRRSFSECQISGHYYNNNDDACFKPIALIDPIVLDGLKGGKLLVTLTVADNWCEKAGDRTWFAIEVDGKICTRGLISAGIDNQRVPIVLQAVYEMDASRPISVKAMWCNGPETNGRKCYIGSWGDLVLTALQID